MNYGACHSLANGFSCKFGELNISMNWFEDLPISIGVLQKLRSLDASHNMLGSSQKALLLLMSPTDDGVNDGGGNDLDTKGIEDSTLHDSDNRNTAIRTQASFDH